ncbi:MAG: hypothetical protein JJU06_20980 [Ectothiorhodospiraceae bacterium]|nr:hypothetical protein [Ectothiorhodospiraceae bacterium]
MSLRVAVAALWVAGAMWSVCVAMATAGGESRKHEGLAADELYRQAIEIDASQTPESASRKLELLTLALARDPEHRQALDYRINVLLDEGRYEQAERDLHRLYEITGLPETRFSLCMVRDHLAGPGESVPDCYLSVAAEYAQIADKPHLDFRYLVALKMAGGDDFTKAKERALLEEGRESEHWGPFGARLDMLESDREELLREFLGKR